VSSTNDHTKRKAIAKGFRFDAEPQSFTSLLRPGISSIPVFLGSIFKTLSSTITRFEGAPNLSTHADFRVIIYSILFCAKMLC